MAVLVPHRYDMLQFWDLSRKPKAKSFQSAGKQLERKLFLAIFRVLSGSVKKVVGDLQSLGIKRLRNY